MVERHSHDFYKKTKFMAIKTPTSYLCGFKKTAFPVATKTGRSSQNSLASGNLFYLN